ncbi:uncharacterized protein LOC62_01G000466 [Vanrija pseudolonga]|uniref:Uncharacterized protein n=1 Tax=Vanrija pseudolonga TaxID=143232 RepID=A0AAF0XZK7_9TREE|nr:hypothetical protein LOC62_01G000466 [Vanrija pseudolonga]
MASPNGGLAGLYERASALNPASLIGISAVLTWFIDVKSLRNEWTLMLFGLVALELSSTGPLRWFLIFVAVAGFFDLLAIVDGSASGFQFILVLALLALKAPIFGSSLVRLRDKGGDIGYPGVDLWQQWQNNQGSQAQHAGGVIGTAPRPAASAPPPPPGAFPSGGGYRLGGDEESQAPRNTNHGGYQPIN